MFRRRRAARTERPGPPPIDLTSLSARWQAPVREALEARTRFWAFVQQSRPGPLRERLEALSREVDRAVEASFQTAVQAQRLEAARGALAEQQATDALKAARRELAAASASGRDTEHLEARVAALAAQHAALHRVWNALEDTERRLRVLDVRLDAVVARTAELALTAGSDGLASVSADLDSVVGELSALRAGLDELS